MRFLKETNYVDESGTVEYLHVRDPFLPLEYGHGIMLDSDNKQLNLRLIDLAAVKTGNPPKVKHPAWK